jgi:DNA modification methylase
VSYQLIRGDATSIPLADGSVDEIVTSPPYFALRSYTDGGEHYDGQIGSEATPQAFLEALWAVTAECRRVLKPSGSMFVNLGDKYSGVSPGSYRRHTQPFGPNGDTATGYHEAAAASEAAAGHDPDWGGIPAKSLMMLPQRYAIGCIDQLGLILRAEMIWSKPNGLPESVTDRVRRSHEQWFHFTKEPRYFSAVDEVREDYSERVQDRQTYAGRDDVPPSKDRGDRGDGNPARGILGFGHRGASPLGKLPGSVWTIPTEPLRVPDHLGVDHFAAFPSEWPRRLILGWSPSGVCVECGEGRRPVVDRTPMPRDEWGHRSPDSAHGEIGKPAWRGQEVNRFKAANPDTITGYACACPTTDAPTRPAVILDPFSGTGTTAAVANALGRHGIGIDLSADYLRLAEWRCNDPALTRQGARRRQAQAGH